MLLALVAQQPAGVYRLKQMFEGRRVGHGAEHRPGLPNHAASRSDGQVVSHAEPMLVETLRFSADRRGVRYPHRLVVTPVPREHPDATD